MENLTISNLLIAFLGGILSFLSPCVLPLVPGYVSLISGVSIDRLKGVQESGKSQRWAVMLNSLAFNVGLSLIFVILGTTAGLVGTKLLSNIWLRLIGGAVIIGFGLQVMGLLKIPALYRDTRFFGQQKPRGLLGSLTLGMAFAAGWTPCIGPILGGIIGLAAASGGWKSGLVLASCYSAGLAVPFLLTGLGIDKFLSFYSRFRQHLHKVEIASGVMLILIGALIMSGKTTALNSSFIASLLPNFEGKLKLQQSSAAPGAGPTGTSAYQKPNDLGIAPEATFKTVGGQDLHISDLRGQVVLLNFWATWCPPCRAEIPAFNDLQKAYEARGLKVVGVLTFDPAESLKEFDIKQDYTVLIGADPEVAKFDVPQALPVTVIIDRDGHVRKRIVGGNDREEFDKVIRPLLDEPAATAMK
jgi:cytochrome c-type biogenesis protein